MGGTISRWRRNPVLIKELRGRIRGKRAYQILAGYLGLLGLFLSMVYSVYTSEVSYTANAQAMLLMGQVIFWSVIGAEMMMVIFITPSLASGAISGERESQTFELLRTTLLPARALVWGKISAIMIFVVMLLVAASPFVAISFLFGGISPVELAVMHEMLLVTAFGFGAVSLAFSARSRRTSTASLLSYAFALIMTGGVPIATLAIATIAANVFAPTGGMLQSLGTQWGAGADYVIMSVLSTNPFATILVTGGAWVSDGSIWMLRLQSFTGGSLFSFPSPWLPYTAFYLLMGLIALELAIRWVRRPMD